jgi:hypothetical protein
MISFKIKYLFIIFILLLINNSYSEERSFDTGKTDFDSIKKLSIALSITGGLFMFTGSVFNFLNRFVPEYTPASVYAGTYELFDTTYKLYINIISIASYSFGGIFLLAGFILIIYRLYVIKTCKNNKQFSIKNMFIGLDYNFYKKGLIFSARILL